MWMQPITANQLRVLKEDWGIKESDDLPGPGWFEVLRPIEKTLACGDVGSGAMRDWKEIVQIIEQRLGI